MPYDNTVPQATQTIAETQPIIQSNFAFIQTDLQVDHIFNGNIPFGTAPEGNHVQCTMKNRTDPAGALPANVNGIWYTGATGGSTGARYYDGTTVCKLTEGNAVIRGYQWLGKVLVQWGFVNTTTTSSYQTLLFATNNINFPNACFSVYAQPYAQAASPPASNGPASVAISDAALLPTGFDWTFTSNSNKYTGFYWLAIGN